jgi:hypothetical protein
MHRFSDIDGGRLGSGCTRLPHPYLKSIKVLENSSQFASGDLC